MNDRHAYRAWHIASKKMFSVATLNYRHGGIRHIVIIGRVPKKDISYIKTTDRIIPKDIILMQSTGLRDKNGKLIFEGDIVSMQVASFEPVIAEVTGYSTLPSLYLTPEKEEHHDMSLWEVIGNKYENGDLMK